MYASKLMILIAKYSNSSIQCIYILYSYEDNGNIITVRG